MVETWIWDAGCWADPSVTFTQPRVFAALRVAEGEGQVKIKGLRYASTSEEVARLKGEPKIAYEGRIEALCNIEKERVKKTAVHFKYDDGFRDDTDKEITLPSPTGEHRRLFVVVMPPGKRRSAVVNQLILKHKQNASILIAPAVFTNANEITQLIENSRNAIKITPYLPYRYSGGMLEVSRRSENRTIEAVDLHVVSGPYPSRKSYGFRSFLAGFCLPTLDCMMSIAGAIEEGSITYKETRGSLPVLVGNLMHEKGVVSSVILSATGNFQSLNFDMRVFFNGSSLELTDAFREAVYRGGPQNEFSESGHDPSAWQRNGALPLLKKVLKGDQNDLPTLESCLNTQTLLDRIFDALARLPASTGKPQQIPF